jgi:adenosylhomocysteine nucleosidase
MRTIGTKFGIIGAMEVEVDLLKKSLLDTEHVTLGGLDFFSGAFADTPAVVVRSGIGKVNAALCAQLLIRDFGVTHIINTGIAGAISSDLRPLDLVLSTDVVYHDVDLTGFGYPPLTLPGMPTAFVADAGLINDAEKAAASLGSAHKTFRGRIASGDVFVASGVARKKIKTIANPLCVEMEGAAIAHAAMLYQTPFVIIRCISDMADDAGLHTYAFNERDAAELCAHLVIALVA